MINFKPVGSFEYWSTLPVCFFLSFFAVFG